MKATISPKLKANSLRAQLRGQGLCLTTRLSQVKLTPRSKEGSCSELYLRRVDNSG